MTRRRLSHIPIKRTVFVGCEGDSESGYVRFLQDLLIANQQAVHLHVEVLSPGAGDPLSRIDMALRRLECLRRTREEPRQRFVLLDNDQAERDPERANRARHKADQNNIVIVWQRPCFEALLLRHLEDRARHRPIDSREAERALVRDWPEYIKPMSRADLARRLDLAAVRRAADVEPELAALLSCNGLV